MEYTIGIATGVPVTFLSNGNNDLENAFFDTANYLASTSNPPSVVTTSYGANEGDFSPSLVMYASPSL